ncbi:unnamed protein product [Meganyctiphanes norvegica]|uniref:Uncharacterized protein n=1 Tax=Meganyctiphanes norvegica TaxID=48144 RepID=A0AAV2Q993_MEGNR
MKTSVIQAFLLCALLAGCQAGLAQSISEMISFRQAKQIFNRLTGFVSRNSPRYPLCQVDDIEGACLPEARCMAEDGRYAGFCGMTSDVCCIVDKTCGTATKAHGSYFHNPSYPKKDNESQACPFTIHIDREVCAVRLDFLDFELAPYGDGACFIDTLTVLGTKLGPSTPVCGNMTGWTTTFTVDEETDVILAMVVQGNPAYKFSIRATQIGCKDINVFQSPTYSGVRNEDAVVYTTAKSTTTTATTPEPTSTMFTDSDKDDDDDDDDDEITTESSFTSTTLRIGEWPSAKPKDPVTIRSIGHFNEEDEEGVYTNSIDATLSMSAFKRVFDLKVNDKFWQYEENPPDIRIVGGENTKLNEWPWQVALAYNKIFLCGGSLISDRHILTAAHCIFGSLSKDIHNLRVSLGDHDLRTKNETKSITSGVKRVLFNLHYSPSTMAHDIALFELSNPVNFSYSISAVKVPQDLSQMFEGEEAIVTGWGRYNISHKKSHDILKQYRAPLMNTDKCVERWRMIFPEINATKPNHVCLDITHGTPCHGDSGGPLVICGDENTCTQVGVVSFGHNQCTNNIGLPAVFTRVSHYKPWIDMSVTQLKMHNIGEEK